MKPGGTREHYRLLESSSTEVGYQKKKEKKKEADIQRRENLDVDSYFEVATK